MPRNRIKIFPADGLRRSGQGRAFIGISLYDRPPGAINRLKAAMDWTTANAGPFDLFVGDYLNRHNYQAFAGMSESAAIIQARHEGARAIDWLQHLVSDRGQDRPQILSAEHFYSDPTFTSRLHRLEQHYAKNAPFKTAIEGAVDAFLSRKHPEKRAEPEVRHHCVAYQLEELALFELMTEAGYNVLVYAGAQLPVMKGLVMGQFKDISPAIEAMTLIEFRTFRDVTV